MVVEHYGVNDGHTETGPGSGAVGILVESKETRIVGQLVRKLLADMGQRVTNCTIDRAASANEALALIVQQANRQDLDWFISIHFNAGGGRGVEAYTYEGRPYPDALNVCKNIAALGFNNRGVKSGTGLYVVRKTKAKSILIEVCFVDTDDAKQYLKVGAYAIAKAIVEGITGIMIQSSKYPMPLKMKYDSPAVAIANGVPQLVKYFYRDQLVTAQGELNQFYKLDINGQQAFIPQVSTVKRE